MIDLKLSLGKSFLFLPLLLLFLFFPLSYLIKVSLTFKTVVCLRCYQKDNRWDCTRYLFRIVLS